MIAALAKPIIEPNHSLPHQAYISLEQAFDFFNNRLFEGKLPPLLITFRKKKGSFGYYWPEVIEHRSGESSPVAELAMNLATFKDRTDKDILSTFVHELCHHWQQCFGEPSRNGYHNKEWGTKMKLIGLHPSSTGKEDGKETGQKVSHYIIKDGLFNELADELLLNGCRIDWQSYEPVKAKKPKAGKEPGEGDDNDEEEAKSKSGVKVKYTCIECKMNVWGREGLFIQCTRDKMGLVQEH